MERVRDWGRETGRKNARNEKEGEKENITRRKERKVVEEITERGKEGGFSVVMMLFSQDSPHLKSSLAMCTTLDLASIPPLLPGWPSHLLSEVPCPATATQLLCEGTGWYSCWYVKNYMRVCVCVCLHVNESTCHWGRLMDVSVPMSRNDLSDPINHFNRSEENVFYH